MNWDIHVFITRDGLWRARIGTWYSIKYRYPVGLATSVGFKLMEDWYRRRVCRDTCSSSTPS